MNTRSTRQRAAVERAVRESRDHPTAQGVYARAREHLPAISLATVYRNLDRLVDEGKIHALHTATAPVRYDGVLDEHAHFVCAACGALSDLFADTSPGVRDQLAADGCAVFGATTMIQGLCRECNREE